MSTTSTRVAFGAQPVDRRARERVAMVVLADHEHRRLGREHELGIVALGEQHERVGREPHGRGRLGVGRRPRRTVPTARPRPRCSPSCRCARPSTAPNWCAATPSPCRTRRTLRWCATSSSRGSASGGHIVRDRDLRPLRRAAALRGRARGRTLRSRGQRRVARKRSRRRWRLDLGELRVGVLGADAEQVAAGGERQHRGLRDAALPLAPCMSSASLTMTPSKPSSPRSSPSRIAGLNVAGRSGSSCGSRMCDVMTVRAPAAMTAANGTSSRSRSSSSGQVDHRQREVRVLRRVAVPGKVLGAARRRPSTAARASTPRRARRRPRASSRSCARRSPGCPRWS